MAKRIRVRPSICVLAQTEGFFGGRENSRWAVGVPKQQGANYIFDGDAPVFCTGPGPVEHPTLERETAQMDSRIRYFLFEHRFDRVLVPEIKPCARCFATWVLAARLQPRQPDAPPPVGLHEYYVRARGRASSSSVPRHTGWNVQRPPGTYRYDDAPGACFRCGGTDHYVRDM